MPLRAQIDGQDVIAAFLSDEEWRALKREIAQKATHIILPCCNSPAYLRVSKLGVKHFVHKTDDACTSGRETWQHIQVKHEVALACCQAGYEVQTEAVGEGWRADVLAAKERVRIAFEVQWSPQTWQETLERQRRYKAAGSRIMLPSRAYDHRRSGDAKVWTARGLIPRARGASRRHSDREHKR